MNGDEGRIVLASFFTGVVIAAWITSAIVGAHWRHEAFRKGYAEYSITTGEWQWKDSNE